MNKRPFPITLIPPSNEAEREILSFFEKPERLERVKAGLFKLIEKGEFSEELWSLYLDSLLIEKESKKELLSSDLLELFLFVAKVTALAGFALTPSFHWRWGIAYYAIGREGGEPWDLQRSIQLFKKAFSLGLEKPVLCFDLARSYYFLHALLPAPSILQETLRWFDEGQRLGGSLRKEDLPHLRAALQALFHETPSDELLLKGQKIFEKELLTEGMQDWKEKGLFFLKAARFKGELPLYQVALEQFQKMEESDGELPELSLLLGETLLGMGIDGERVDLLRESQNFLEHSAELFPDQSRPLQLLGESYLEEGALLQDKTLLELAVETYQEALAVDPNSSEGFWGLARVYTLLGEICTDPLLIEKASFYHAEAEALSKSPQPLFYADWGYSLLKLGEMTQERRWIEGAIQRLEKAVRLLSAEAQASPPPSDWIYHLGCCYDLLGDQSLKVEHYEKAIHFLTKTLALDPVHPYVRFNLATALSHLGEAISDPECFEKAFELFRSQAEKDLEDDVVFAEWGVSLLTLADLLEDLSLEEKKRELFKEAEERLEWARRQGNLHAHYHLACLHSLQGHLEMSLHFLERGAKLQALPPLEEMCQDEWLEKVREVKAFQELCDRLKLERPK